MISIVNPNDVEQLLRPTVYRPSGGVVEADVTRALGSGLAERGSLVEEHAEQRGAPAAANPNRGRHGALL